MGLTLDSVSRTVRGELHIDDISLEFPAGSFNVLLGLTLAGKTTLLRLMAGLDKPTSGRVWMNGKDVTDVPVRKRNVAMVYQQFINYPSLTVYDNIASPLRQAKRPKAEIDRRVRAEAERLHIDRLLDRLPGELSGGQQQRTAIARALVRDADLVLLDEPLVNLDYKLREELRADMREIFARSRAVVVYATTDPREALTLGGNTGVLDKGRLVQFGPTLDVYHRPAREAVAHVFAEPPMNTVDGQLGDDGIVLSDGTRIPTPPHLAMLPSGRYRFGIRPFHATVARRSPAQVEIATRLEVPEISGSETYLHVRHNNASWVIQEEGVHLFELGATIPVFLDPNRLFAFDTEGALAAAPTPPPALQLARA